MRVPGITYVQGRNAYSDSDGTKYGVAIHNTANDASAAGEASYATRRADGVSAHFYVDADTVIQSLDTSSRAGHAGSAEGNNHAVAIEITGTNDKPRSWWLANVAWDQLGAVLAVVCRRYGIAVRRASVPEMTNNPRVRAFYGHNDMRLAWGGTTHTDPGPNFPWDHLLQVVADALDPEGDDMAVTDADAAKIATANWAATFGPETAGGRLAELVVGMRTLLATGVSDSDAERLLAELRAQGEQIRAEMAAAAAADAARDAELRALVEQHAAGALDAEAVVARMGELLSGAGSQA